MHKKIQPIILALVMMLSLTACQIGNTEIPNSNHSDTTINADSVPSNNSDGNTLLSFYDIFESEKYYMKTKMLTPNDEMSEVEIYVDGDNIAMNITVEGKTVRVISQDEKTYIIDDEEEVMLEFVNSAILADNSSDVSSESSPDNYVAILTDILDDILDEVFANALTGFFADIIIKTEEKVYSGSSRAEFAESDLPYEEYSINDNKKVQYFLQNHDLIGIRTINNDDTFDIEIYEFNQIIPSTVFELPNGYQQISF